MKAHHSLLPIAASVLASIALSACHRAEVAAPTVRPVVTITVKSAQDARAPIISGEIQPRYRTALSFRVPGNIVERKARLGDHVNAGQILATLDPADFGKNVAIAKQQVEISQQHLTLARNQVERDRLQAKDNLIGAAQLEQTETNFAAATAQLEQARKQLDLANNQLHYATLVADHAGVISAELANTGDNVAAGQAIYQLNWNGDVDVVADVAESTVATIANGSKAVIMLPSVPGRTFNATVREIAPEADSNSRTFKVKFTLEQPAGAPLGSTAQIQFVAPGSTNAASPISIPATALFHEDSQTAVWVVQPDNKLMLRKVQVARYTDSAVLVSEGLAQGERIVAQGVHTVANGQAVRPVAAIGGGKS